MSGSMPSQTDTVVIGAGPAGLAAGVALRQRGVGVLVVDQGYGLAERVDGPGEELVTGAGGAGLYSDGKFSFFPSASRLWELEPAVGVREAYAWVAELLAERKILAPRLPPDLNGAMVVPEAGASTMKAYPSMYVDVDDRRELIKTLTTQLGDALLLRMHAQVVDPRSPLVALRDRATGEERVLRPRSVVFAAGRFGPLSWPSQTAPAIFRRVEVGVRIEQPADRFFLAHESGIDPKWIGRSSDGRCEWRTFCCCRQGEVVATSFDGVTTVSGRADCPPTGRSNVGLNVRLLDRDDAETAMRALLAEKHVGPVTATAAEMLADPDGSPVIALLGAPTGRRIMEGLYTLVEEFALDTQSAVLHAPTIEGLGYYPSVDRSLRVDGLPVWVAGDSSGMFRGIVAALISGRVAAMAAARHAISEDS
jgi:uncharacterized protein